MPYADVSQQREYQRKWMAKRRADYLADKCCVDCDSIEKLEIDHVDPREKVSHRIWSWSEKRRAAELAKCVVRCHSCHVAKTTLELDRAPAAHGLTLYRRGCKCEVCKAAKRAANARARNKEPLTRLERAT